MIGQSIPIGITRLVKLNFLKSRVDVRVDVVAVCCRRLWMSWTSPTSVTAAPIWRDSVSWTPAGSGRGRPLGTGWTWVRGTGGVPGGGCSWTRRWRWTAWRWSSKACRRSSATPTRRYSVRRSAAARSTTTAREAFSASRTHRSGSTDEQLWTASSRCAQPTFLPNKYHGCNQATMFFGVWFNHG